MVMVGVYVFMCGLVSLCYNRFHMLSMLLSLEMMMLGIFMGLTVFMGAQMYELILFYLVLVVCEASLGLGVMVMGVYYYGSDHMNSYSSLLC